MSDSRGGEREVGSVREGGRECPTFVQLPFVLSI